jgi:predicted amidohydrolase
VALVTCHQLAPRIGDLGANVELSVAAVRAAVQAGASVVVLPELVTSGYVFESRCEAAAAAITAEHPVFVAWADEIARTDAIVVAGFCEQGNEGALYNSAAVVDASGVRTVYRKAHLWDREKLWFEPGDTLPPVVATTVGRIGVAICYDLEFPELTRHLAITGADLIAVPTNWPLIDRPLGERPPEVVIAMAAARSNRVAIACCDRTGTERGQHWTAGTTIIGADGWPLATADASDIAIAEVDLAASRNKRSTELSDVLGDRRTDLY